MKGLMRVGTLGLAAVFLAGFGPAATAGDIKIGLLFSQTGPISSYGVPMRKAAEYAVSAINAKGGINGNKLVLVVEDDESTGAAFINGLHRAVDQEHVLALVGPIVSGMVKAGGPIVKRSGVVMFTPTATAPDLTKDNPYVFRNNPSEDDNIQRLLTLMVKDHPQIKTLSIIYDNKEPADKVNGGIYERLAPKIGWKVTGVTTFLSGQLNFSDLITKVLSGKPDIVAASAHGADAANVARELRRQGYKGIILGGTPTVSQDYLKIAGPAADDTYVVVPYFFGADTPQNEAFTKGYAKASGQTTPDPWEASTDEVVGMIAAAARTAKVSGDPAKLQAERTALRDALAATKDYAGLIGPVSLDPERIAQKKTMVIRVKDNRWQPF